MTKSDPEVKATALNGRVDKSEIVIAEVARRVAFPSRVKVGVLWYTTSLNEKEGLKREAENGGGACWGFSDHRAQTIWINPNVSRRAMAVTLIHELLHCVSFTSNVAERFHVPDFGEEELVGAISAPLYGVMLDNPDLVRWLMQIGESDG